MASTTIRVILEQHLRRAWLRRGPLARLLWPVALVHGVLAALRRAFHRVGWLKAARLPVPVIVVGNVVAGGAGKTPTTLAIAQHLKARGWRPGIVSRGHGRRSATLRAVAPGDDPRDVGDEPLLLRRQADVPVHVAARRAEAGRALLAAHPEVDVLLCDDGLQHLTLARDVEICVFDARGIGNGWLLPAGPLREPWPRPADLDLWTEPAPPGKLDPTRATFHATRHLAAQARRADGTQVPLVDLRDRPLVALAAIARPEAFFAMLRAAGLQPAHCIALPDHHAFDRLPPLLAHAATLVCTEKDAPKLWRHRPDAWAVPLQLDLPADFLAALDTRLAEWRAPGSAINSGSP